MNSICSQKPEVAGLWIGETLPPLAELCIRSYLSRKFSNGFPPGMPSLITSKTP